MASRKLCHWGYSLKYYLETFHSCENTQTNGSYKSSKPHRFLFQLSLLLLFFSCPSVFESPAPLSLWHCPIFPLSVCLSISFSHSARFSAARALSFWTMTLRDSCNVRRLAILAGAFESRGSGEGEGLYLRLGALTSLITLFFSLLSLCLLQKAISFQPTEARNYIKHLIIWMKMCCSVYTLLIHLCPQFLWFMRTCLLIWGSHIHHHVIDWVFMRAYAICSHVFMAEASAYVQSCRLCLLNLCESLRV